MLLPAVHFNMFPRRIPLHRNPFIAPIYFANLRVFLKITFKVELFVRKVQKKIRITIEIIK